MCGILPSVSGSREKFLQVRSSPSIGSASNATTDGQSRRKSIGNGEAASRVNSPPMESLESLRRDVRIALRVLGRSPGFSTTVVLTMAVAIGVNTAVFTVANAVLFKGFRGIEHNDRILYVGTQRQGRGCCVSYPDFLDWRAQTHSFTGLAAVADLQIVVSSETGTAEHYDATRISTNGFTLLGRRPILGRDFVTSDGTAGAPPVAVLQYSFWRHRYALDPAVLGRTMAIDGIPTTIVGVMPEDVSFPQNQDVWLPLVQTADLQRRESRSLWFAFGRLVDGATLESARAELAAIGRGLSVAYPATNEGWVPQPRTFAEFFVGRDAPAIYGTLWAAVGFVVLIACANVANLVLSRGFGRAPEWSMLAALGASRWQIVRRQLTESAILSSIGAMCGWWIARMCVATYEVTANPPARAWSAHLFDYTMDQRVLAYAALLSIATTVVFGLWPAMYVSRFHIGHRRHGHRLAASLVAIEIATAVVLLVGAGLMVRSYAAMAHADLGIKPGQVHAMLVSLPRDRYASPSSQARFFERLTTRLRETPGVRSIALADELPAGNGRRVGYELVTDAPADARYRDTVSTFTISPGYFDAVGAAIRAGRDFTRFDTTAEPAVAIVNQRFADTRWPGEDPLGKRMRLFDDSTPGPWMTVVGVASNIVQNVTDRQVKDALVYRPFAQRPARSAWAVAKIGNGALNLPTAFRAAIDGIDRDVPIWVGPFPLDALMAAMGNYWLLGNNTAMFAAFAAVALLVASLGIYAVVAYSVSRRTKEFGIRLAIGAAPQDILTLVLGESAWPITGGLVIGILASLALAPLLRSQLVHVTPGDPATLILASGALIACALVGCLLPAYRATTIAPAIALRIE